MARDFAKAFYGSKAWLKCRAAFVKSRFGLCERCGKAGLIVHHKILLTPANIHDPSVTLNWENLEYLCLDCHNRTHGASSTADDVEFDEDGNLIRVEAQRL